MFIYFYLEFYCDLIFLRIIDRINFSLQFISHRDLKQAIWIQLFQSMEKIFESCVTTKTIQVSIVQFDRTRTVYLAHIRNNFEGVSSKLHHYINFHVRLSLMCLPVCVSVRHITDFHHLTKFRCLVSMVQQLRYFREAGTSQYLIENTRFR